MTRRRARAAERRRAATAVELPSAQKIRTWVRQTMAFYSGYPEGKIEDAHTLLEPPLEIDAASLVDLAGTLRHGVKNYNANETVLVADVDDETVGGITATVTTRIRGG